MVHIHDGIPGRRLPHRGARNTDVGAGAVEG